MTKVTHCPFNSRNYRNSVEVSASFISAPANQPPYPLPCVCYVSWFLLAQLLHPHGFCSLTSPARKCLFCIALLVWASTITTRHLSFNFREKLVHRSTDSLCTRLWSIINSQTIPIILPLWCLWEKCPQIIYFQKLK